MAYSAFIAMQYSEPYESIYKVLDRILTKHGFISIRADQIPRSTPFTEDIEDSIRFSELVIVEASEKNTNVYIEFGIARALKKEILLLTSNSENIPSDIRHLRHLIYDPSDHKNLEIDFSKWLKATNAYTKKEYKKEYFPLSRGEVFKDFYDSASFADKSNISFEEQIETEIKNSSMISCGYSYYTDKGTLHWIRLCNQPLYKVFTESVKFLSSNLKEILKIIDETTGINNPDIISLGPGNGKKDIIFLKTIIEFIKGKKKLPSFFYYPVDISRRMIGITHKEFYGDKALNYHVKFKGINFEFSMLPSIKPIIQYRNEPKIFLFFGNTFGNIQNEMKLLRSISNTMEKDDYLILEVRRKVGEFKLGGHEEDQYGLSFSPLYRLGVEYDPNKIFRERVDTFSQVQGTTTIATLYGDIEIDNQKYENLMLSCVNYYDTQALEKVLNSNHLGLNVLKTFQTDYLGIYIVQKI